MKKLLAILLCVTLTLGITGIAVAAELSTSINLEGEISFGYLVLPGYQTSISDSPDFDNDGNRETNNVFQNGAVFSKLRSFRLKLINDVTFSEGFYGQLVSQLGVWKDDSSRPITDSDDGYELYTSAVQNINLTYNPGKAAMFQFDLKGQDIPLGIKDDEMLKLNVARRYAKDGEPNIFQHFDEVAKQLTVQVPFGMGRVVSVFSLERTEAGGIPLVGGFGELLLGNQKVALGYQAKMADKNYAYKVPEAYYVLATDFNFAPNFKVQLDYSTRDDGGVGYTAYLKPIDVIETYPGTSFKIIKQLNSRLTLNNYQFKLRLLGTTNDEWKYWADAAYSFKPFTVGVNYRDWCFDKESLDAQADGYVAEFYVKHDLTSSWRDYLKVFYRTDQSYGAILMYNFW